MTRYVVTADIAIRLAEARAPLADGVDLVAPTLLRSQALSMLYQRVANGSCTESDAKRQLDYIRGLRIRLLGDRVLQSVAWAVAAELEAPDTFQAEYIALTKLQADALVTGDLGFRAVAAKMVAVATIDQLIDDRQ